MAVCRAWCAFSTNPVHWSNDGSKLSRLGSAGRNEDMAMLGRLLSAGFVLLIATAGARAEDVLHVGKAVPPDFGYTVVNVGIAAGTFAKHGLQVEAIDFAGAPKLH